VQHRWILAPPEELNGSAISWNEICRLECIARLLLRKGFSCREEVEAFLRPRLNLLSDPFLLPQMEAAAERILAALARHERVVLFGDYDVDGVTSLTLLSEMMRALGGSPQLFLPLRMEEGYGLSRESVERCVASHRPQLLIAVDCGTSSQTEIAELKRRGIDVIVLDHHEPKSVMPDCVAVVNPKTDPESPFHYLCSVGIVFKLCHALLKIRPLPDFDLRSGLDLVALGTVADIVPLCGENRIFVQRGAVEIARSGRPGLRRLMERASVRPPVLTEDIGFRLGPRLNAAGRLSTAEKSLRLLLTRDDTEAMALAELLDKQNQERQEVEKEIFRAGEEQIAREFDPGRDAAIIVGGKDWHPGVLGIVASRIARRYHRPAIVIGFDGEGLGKGSARSIERFHLVKALECCAPYLEKFGGHEAAAGLTLRQENIDKFAEAFRQTARQKLSPDDLQPRLRLDYELELSDLNVEFLHWHEMLQPFGNSNPQPLFLARNVEPAAPPQVVNDKHLTLRLRQQNACRRAVFFDGASEPLPPAPWDIAFRIRPDDYNGQRLVGMQVQAMRSAVSLT
jgi:single-stranded-DNA-specific exonuclease